MKFDLYRISIIEVLNMDDLDHSDRMYCMIRVSTADIIKIDAAAEICGKTRSEFMVKYSLIFAEVFSKNLTQYNCIDKNLPLIYTKDLIDPS